ncbi:MAG: hypothetical protein PGN13_08845 [Patulibacter minatonensis]
MRRLPISPGDLLGSLADPYGSLSQQYDSPRAAAVRWLQDGLLPAAAPEAAIAEAVAAGPVAVEVSSAELWTIEQVLGVRGSAARPTEPAPEERAAAEGTLRARGIIEPGRRGPVLAPAFLPTLGIAVCAGRSIGIEAQEAATGEWWPSTGYARAGRRAVAIARRADQAVAVRVVDPAADDAERAVRGAVDELLNGRLATLQLATTAREIVNTNISVGLSQEVQITAAAGTVLWQQRFTSGTTALTADELRARVDERLRAGAEVEEVAAGWAQDAAERIARDGGRSSARSNVRDALVGHVEGWAVGGDFKRDERIRARSERDRRTLAAEYWA